MAKIALPVAALVAALASPAHATPSTTYWAPTTTYVQPYLVPHVTYDTYFTKEAAYPITTGLTMGILPWDKLQLEIGFDLVVPSSDPLYLNAKLGTPEDTFFSGSPSLAVGIFAVGTKGDSTDYDALSALVQKNLPWGGYVAVGGYYGVGSDKVWTSSDGSVNRAGFLGAITSPDIKVDLPGLKKLIFVADVQTGNNSLGAGGPGVYIYFNDSIDLLTGPVFFFDKDLQPGQSSWMWTLQLDIDVTLLAPAK
jgi:hypothetical protein